MPDILTNEKIPVKRQYTSKAGNAKIRPLGILVLEDKIVQGALQEVGELCIILLYFNWYFSA